MIRLTIFLFGFVLLLLGAASNFKRIPMPVDLTTIEASLGFVSLTLDVLLIVVGVFLVLIAWVFHKLDQG